MTHYTTYLHDKNYGHIIVAPTGMPLGEMSRICGSYNRKAIMNPGIAHHYEMTQFPNNSVFVICHNHQAATDWHKEINEKIAIYPPELRWLYGIDTGTSSLTIFAALASVKTDISYHSYLKKYKQTPSTPSDASDLGRCIRLCDKLDWHDRIPELADFFPTSHWPAIAARWQELREATPANATEILRAIHT